MDVILALVAVEAIALAVHHKRTGKGIAPRNYLANLAAGLALLLTARLALGDAPAWQLALGLLASLVAHLIDLAGRWTHGGTEI